MSEELKPCPVCGSENLEVRIMNTRDRYVHCCDCGTEGEPEVGDRDDWISHISQWNSRNLRKITEDGLKHCPLCGSAVEVVKDGEWWTIECTGCHARTGGRTYLRGCVETWQDGMVPRAPAIKSCPICGTAAVYWQSNGKYYVSCDNGDCDFRTPLMDSKQEAADFWNREVINAKTED